MNIFEIPLKPHPKPYPPLSQPETGHSIPAHFIQYLPIFTIFQFSTASRRKNKPVGINGKVGRGRNMESGKIQRG